MKKLALIVTLCLGSHAFGITMFSNQADFLAELNNPHYYNSFNNLGYGSINAPSASFGPVNSYSYTMTASTDNVASAFKEMTTEWEGAVLQITFTGKPVFAVGGEFFTRNWDALKGNTTVVVELTDGATQSYSALGFRGFTSDVEIASLSVGQSGGSAWATVDNFYVGKVVPEPATLALLGLMAVGVARRSRR